MSSFFSNAGRKVTDVRQFLRDAAGGTSIKYTAEKGARHLIYIPLKTVTEVGEDGVEVTRKQVEAAYGAVHEWQSADGKFKSTICMHNVIRKADDGETLLNDGSCPFCDRVEDGWNIYNYRKDLEESNCKLTGEDRKKYLEKVNKDINDERKAKAARTYMYLLVVKFRASADGTPVINAESGMPEYDLKIMKLSQTRVDKISQQLQNSGCEFPGSELVMEYPAVEDRRLQISQSTTSPVFPNNMLTVKYPGLIAKIDQDVAKFTFDSIEKSFPEWAGMTVSEAKRITDGMFEKWDEYNKQLVLNPGAKYMEYVNNTPVTQPSLGGAPIIPGVPLIPGVAIPNVAPVMPAAAPVVPTMPTVPVMPTAPAAPVVPAAPAAPVVPTAPAAPAAPTVPPVPTVPSVDSVFQGGSGMIQI